MGEKCGKFLLRMHLSFMGLLGGVALLAEFNAGFAAAKQYASTHDGSIFVCYGAWIILYSGKAAVGWKLRKDLDDARAENRRIKRRK